MDIKELKRRIKKEHDYSIGIGLPGAPLNDVFDIIDALAFEESLDEIEKALSSLIKKKKEVNFDKK
jgi:hypothetical protein